MAIIFFIFAGYNTLVLLYAYSFPDWYKNKAFVNGVQPNFVRLTIVKSITIGVSIAIGLSLK